MFDACQLEVPCFIYEHSHSGVAVQVFEQAKNNNMQTAPHQPANT